MISEHYGDVDGVPVQSAENGKILCRQMDCAFRCHRIKQLRQHLVYEHTIGMTNKTLYFESYDGFEKWKSVLEDEGKVAYKALSNKTNKSDNPQICFYCSRGRHTRTNTALGTSSVNQCTATIEVHFNRTTGSVTADHFQEHYGHVVVPEASSSAATIIPIVPKKDRDVIKQYIDDGKDEDVYREKLFREGIDETTISTLLKEFNRILHYRMYAEADKNFDFDSPPPLMLQFIEEHNRNGVFVHKARHKTPIVFPHDPRALEDIKCLAPETFLVGLMSQRQVDAFLMYSHTVILHFIGRPGFQKDVINTAYGLIIFVLNNKGEALPIGMFFSNSELLGSLRCFFYAIRQKCSYLKTKLLLGNFPEGPSAKDSDYRSITSPQEAWLQVFGEGDCIKYFVSPWYSEYHFINIVNQSCPKDEQEVVIDTFKELLYEKDINVFNELYPNMVKLLMADESMVCIYNHWTSHLMDNKAVWATCYCPDHIAILCEVNDAFSHTDLVRLKRFTKNNIGRCMYLCIQYMTGKMKRALPSRAPGKRPNPIDLIPKLDPRIVFDQPEDNRNYPDLLTRLVCGDNNGRIIKQELTGAGAVMESRKRKLHVKNYVKKASKLSIPNTPSAHTNPKQEVHHESHDPCEEEELEEIRSLIQFLKDRLPYMDRYTLINTLRATRDCLHEYPSRDASGCLIRPLNLNELIDKVESFEDVPSPPIVHKAPIVPIGLLPRVSVNTTVGGSVKREYSPSMSSDSMVNVKKIASSPGMQREIIPKIGSSSLSSMSPDIVACTNRLSASPAVLKNNTNPFTGPGSNSIASNISSNPGINVKRLREVKPKTCFTFPPATSMAVHSKNMRASSSTLHTLPTNLPSHKVAGTVSNWPSLPKIHVNRLRKDAGPRISSIIERNNYDVRLPQKRNVVRIPPSKVSYSAAYRESFKREPQSRVSESNDDHMILINIEEPSAEEKIRDQSPVVSIFTANTSKKSKIVLS